jgi:hypothetical protein
MAATPLLQAYARRIRTLRRADANAPETALAPAFQQLVEALLPLLPAVPQLVVSPEFLNAGVGRPDIALVRPGAPPRAFIELKSPNKSADPTRWRDHDRRQFERFKELNCWATCNFADLRFFNLGEEIGSASIVPERTLRPDQDDKRADKAIADHDAGSFLRLLEQLCISAGQEPNARDARHLATLLAHSARLVRGIVQARLAELHANGNPVHPLLQVRQEFREVLYAHPEAGGYPDADFNVLFSAAFAQTLAFGLLLVREATGEKVGPTAWQHMPEEHPLMRTALRVLSLDEVVRDVGIGFDVICDTVNSFEPEILVTPPNGSDPILYFYEYFLETFDPIARERFGVYYTPLEVVRYIVGALDRSLRDCLGTRGLRDPQVTILDPAVGTGTFLLGIAERVREQATAEAGTGMAALALQDLARRMYGFELLVGPYAVAHYRLHHALSGIREGNGEEVRVQLPRLGVYLADTLAEPGAAAPAGPLGFVSVGIADERREANRIKTEQPILAIIGNPPYRRLSEGENRTLVGDWLDNIWDDLKEPVRTAGQGGQLNTFPELSVAFWRWAIWKLFESQNAPRRGVIAFISNRKFLTGWPYAGLRQMLRERFDRIEIIDLRGDVRRGERAGVEGDQGVFNIMVGTAITIAVADGSKAVGEAADVFYNDSWTRGYFSRGAKFDWLTSGVEAGTLPDSVQVRRGLLDDMRPAPFLNGELISLPECFSFYRSGIQTKRDSFVYSISREALLARLRDAYQSEDERVRDSFSETTARPWSVARTRPVLENGVVLVSYRPLDRKWLYNNSDFIDRPRPELQEVWGESNVCLYAMPSGTGAGPAVWCHGLLPDYHSFRGSYGGYAFPLWDRRPNVNGANVSLGLIAALSAAYGQQVGSQSTFDAMLCLLSASSYSSRFAEDLEDTFPHAPFPVSPDVFAEAVRVGGEIRQLETFSREPGEAYRRHDFVRLASVPRGALVAVDLADGEIVLCGDGTGRVTGLPQHVWEFAVSGYRVLPRWLETRIGQPVDLNFVEELRDICGRIAELIDLFAQADIVLESTMGETLSREALGFVPNAQDVNDGPE